MGSTPSFERGPELVRAGPVSPEWAFPPRTMGKGTGHTYRKPAVLPRASSTKTEVLRSSTQSWQPPPASPSSRGESVPIYIPPPPRDDGSEFLVVDPLLSELVPARVRESVNDVARELFHHTGVPIMAVAGVTLGESFEEQEAWLDGVRERVELALARDTGNLPPDHYLLSEFEDERELGKYVTALPRSTVDKLPRYSDDELREDQLSARGWVRWDYGCEVAVERAARKRKSLSPATFRHLSDRYRDSTRTVCTHIANEAMAAGDAVRSESRRKRSRDSTAPTHAARWLSPTGLSTRHATAAHKPELIAAGLDDAIWASPDVTDKLRHYANSVFAEWGIGGAHGWDSGILIVLWRARGSLADVTSGDDSVWLLDVVVGRSWGDAPGNYTLIDNLVSRVITPVVTSGFAVPLHDDVSEYRRAASMPAPRPRASATLASARWGMSESSMTGAQTSTTATMDEESCSEQEEEEAGSTSVDSSTSSYTSSSDKGSFDRSVMIGGEFPDDFDSASDRFEAVLLAAIDKIRTTLVDVAMLSKGGMKYAISPEAVLGYRSFRRSRRKSRRTRSGGEPRPCPCQACVDARGGWGLFPPLPIQGVYYQMVVDHARVFGPRATVSLETRLRDVFDTVRAPIVLVTLLRVVNRDKLKGRFARYARGMFNNWRLGYKEWNHGILVVYSVHDHKVVVVPGEDWDSEMQTLAADIEVTLSTVVSHHNELRAELRAELPGQSEAQDARFDDAVTELGYPFNAYFPALLADTVASLAAYAKLALRNSGSTLSSETSCSDSDSDAARRPGPRSVWPRAPRWRPSAIRPAHSGYRVPSSSRETAERESVIDRWIMPYSCGTASPKPTVTGAFDHALFQRMPHDDDA